MSFMTIRVVNKHYDKSEGVYIGRPFCLGNPFSHLPKTQAKFKVSSREEAVARFEQWLRENVNVDREITKTMKQLYKLWQENGELTLVCWCKPAACHGDIIQKLLEEKRARS